MLLVDRTGEPKHRQWDASVKSGQFEGNPPLVHGSGGKTGAAQIARFCLKGRGLMPPER